MSELTKKLHILKTGGTEETATLYDSTDDCTEPRISFSVDGANAYAKLGATDDENATTFRVYRDSDKATYAVLKTAVVLVNVTITQSEHQTIHVYTPQKDGGIDHTESFKIAKGTTYEAEVIADDGYEAGTLTVTGGGVNNTFTADTVFTVSAASALVTFTAQYWMVRGEPCLGFIESDGYGAMTPQLWKSADGNSYMTVTEFYFFGRAEGLFFAIDSTKSNTDPTKTPITITVDGAGTVTYDGTLYNAYASAYIDSSSDLYYALNEIAWSTGIEVIDPDAVETDAAELTTVSNSDDTTKQKIFTVRYSF